MRECVLGVTQLVGCCLAFLSCLWLLALLFVLHEMDAADLELLFFHVCKIIVGLVVLVASCLLSMGAFAACASFVRTAMLLYAVSAVAAWVIRLAEREVVNTDASMNHVFGYTLVVVLLDLGLLGVLRLIDDGHHLRPLRLELDQDAEASKCDHCGSRPLRNSKREDLYAPS